MKKSLLYFSFLIIVLNILIIGVGFITNIAFIDRFMGGLITVGTDQITFILGAGTIFPISLLIPVFEGVIENFNLSVLGEDFYFSFVRAAFLEEASKWLVLIFFCVKSREFNEPMDAIVYGVAVSLGFAAYENWEYVRIALYESSDMASTVAWMRSFTAIPLHALAGIFMGFFLLSSIFEEENKNYYRRLWLCGHVPRSSPSPA